MTKGDQQAEDRQQQRRRGTRNRPVLGVAVVLPMTSDGTDKWSGQVYNAEDGKTYKRQCLACPAPPSRPARAVSRSSARPRPGRARTDSAIAARWPNSTARTLGSATFDRARLLHADVHAALHRGPRAHGVEPALQVGKLERPGPGARTSLTQPTQAMSAME